MPAYEEVETFEPLEGTVIPDDESIPPPADNNDDTLLDWTQKVRIEVIKGISQKGINVNDDKLMGTLKAMLDGMDKQSLGKKKIEAKKEVGADMAIVARLLEEASRQVAKETRGQGISHSSPALPKRDQRNFDYDIEAEFRDITDSEKSASSTSESSEDFFKRMERDSDEDD